MLLFVKNQIGLRFRLLENPAQTPKQTRRSVTWGKNSGLKIWKRASEVDPADRNSPPMIGKAK